MICQPVPASLEGALERDCFELNRRGCWLTSPRLRGEVGFYVKRKIRVRGTLRELNAWKQPLTPTLSPRRAGRGRSGPPLQPKLIMLWCRFRFEVPVANSRHPVQELPPRVECVEAAPQPSKSELRSSRPREER